MKLLVTTRSKGKLPEIAALLKDLPLELLTLNDVSGIPAGYEVEETAATFEGNALIKALVFAYKTGFLTVADDSGLEVDALGGKPGVYSARYAPGSDMDRCEKLLRELNSVPEERRGAQFRCALALCDPQTDRVRTCEGKFEGRIAFAPQGTYGFGYDPIFFSTEGRKTSAEMTFEEKNALSHRARAFRIMREIIEKEFLPG